MLSSLFELRADLHAGNEVQEEAGHFENVHSHVACRDGVRFMGVRCAHSSPRTHNLDWIH